jgi:hypothetical protein
MNNMKKCNSYPGHTTAARGFAQVNFLSVGARVITGANTPTTSYYFLDLFKKYTKHLEARRRSFRGFVGATEFSNKRRSSILSHGR